MKSSLAPQVSIDELSPHADYEQVTVLIKVHSVEEKVEVKPDLWKQEVIVADGSASTKITLWQSDIGKLEPNQSYLIHNITVSSYRGIKSLSVSYSGDVKPAVQEDVKETIKDVHVMGVSIEMNKMFVYIKCESKVEPTNSLVGRCVKCFMAQKLATCKNEITGKLLIGKENVCQKEYH